MPSKKIDSLKNWKIDYRQTIGLIFDVDELLIDNSKEIYAAYASLLGSRNIPLDTRETFPGKDLFEIINTIRTKYSISDPSEVLIEERRRNYLKLLRVRHGTVNPGVKEVLDFLDRNRERLNVRMAYASSSEKAFIDIILQGIFRDCGLDNYAAAPDRFFSFEDGRMGSTCWEPGDLKKPSPMVYLKTMQKLGLDARQCIAFEDSKSGVESALKAGVYVFVVPSRANREYFDKIQKESDRDPRMEILTSLNDVLPFLASLPTIAGANLSEITNGYQFKRS